MGLAWGCCPRPCIPAKGIRATQYHTFSHTGASINPQPARPVVEPLEPRRLLTADLAWAARVGGPAVDGVADVGADRLGNAYVAGAFHGTADFDPGPGSAARSSAGGKDGFLAKYSSAGTLRWVRTFGSPGEDDGMAVAVDPAGNVAVSGYFAGTVDFDPGAGTRRLTAAGPSDAFVARFRPDGSLVWAQQVTGGGDAGGTAVAFGPGGDVYSFGMFRGAATVGGRALRGRGDLDVYLARFSAAGGTVTAALAFGGPGLDYANGVAVDAGGAAHLIGSFTGTADFDPGTGVRNLTAAGASDVFLATIDAGGRLTSARAIGGPGVDQAGDLALGPGGALFVTGHFAGTADLDPGPGVRSFTSAGQADAFVLRLSAGGQYAWAKRFGGGGRDRGTDLAVDAYGNAYVTGHFAGTVDFDPGPGRVALASAAGSSDAFVVKLTAAGGLGWARRLGGSGADVGEGVVLGPGATLLAVGRFAGTADLDPGTGVWNLTAPGGTDDGYVVKLKVV